MAFLSIRSSEVGAVPHEVILPSLAIKMPPTMGLGGYTNPMPALGAFTDRGGPASSQRRWSKLL